MYIPGAVLLANAVWQWVNRLGGPGLILLGLVDNSVVPIPGGMDIFVVLLTANHRNEWLYFAVMAMVGAMVGGYFTYRLAKKGGEETLEKKVGKRRVEKVYEKFKKGGFMTVAVSAVIPPPFPMVPVLMAAGVLQYPPGKFLSALGVGRGLRFLVLAYLSHRYGTVIISWLYQYYRPLLYGLIGLAVVGGLGVLGYLKWGRNRG